MSIGKSGGASRTMPAPVESCEALLEVVDVNAESSEVLFELLCQSLEISDVGTVGFPIPAT